MKQHTKSCQQWKKAEEDYKKQWPDYCKECNGTGELTWTEDQSPLGSGYYWPEQMWEPCICVMEYRCPRCSKRLIDFFSYWWNSINAKVYRNFTKWEEKGYKKLKTTHWKVALNKPQKDNWKGWIWYRVCRYTRESIMWFMDLYKPNLPEEEIEVCPYCNWTMGSEGVPIWECYCYEEQEQ